MRDGDEWVLNGSKIWTTGAWWSDWGLCLARTNWDVPKHRGLTVFMVPIHQPGIEVHRIEMLNGSREFCQEFLTDVVVPDTDRIGEVDDGWTVGTRWMFHERMLYDVALRDGAGRATHGTGRYVRRARGRPEQPAASTDPAVRDLIGEARMLELVGQALQRRVGEGIRPGPMSDQSAAIGRLFTGVTSARIATIAFELAGPAGAAWSDDDGAVADCGDRLPDAPGVVHRRRHHRDGPQRHQRAGARHAARAHAGPRRPVPRRPAQPFHRYVVGGRSDGRTNGVRCRPWR